MIMLFRENARLSLGELVEKGFPLFLFLSVSKTRNANNNSCKLRVLAAILNNSKTLMAKRYRVIGTERKVSLGSLLSSPDEKKNRR